MIIFIFFIMSLNQFIIFLSTNLLMHLYVFLIFFLFYLLNIFI